MPAKIFGQAAIPAVTNTTLFTVAALKEASFALNLCNTTSSPITVRVAKAAAATPVDGEFVEYDATIPANGVLERAGMVLTAGMRLVIRASAVGINAQAWGYEK